MATNVSDLATELLTDEVVKRAGALVGESPEATRQILSTAVPAIVGGIAAESATPPGAERVARIVRDAERGEDGKAALGDLLHNGSGEDLVERGTGLLGRILGPRMGDLVESTVRVARAPTSKVTALLGLAGTIVIGVIVQHAQARGLDAAGLASLLAEQERRRPEALDGAARHEPAARDAVARAEPPGRREAPAIRGSRFWPLLVLVPVAVILGVLGTRHPVQPLPDNRYRPGFGVGVPSRVIPPAAEPTTPTVDALRQYLASPSAEPTRRFTFADLTFDVATANLTPQAVPTLDGIAAALARAPNARILVEGHTDVTGNAEDNQRLSLARAQAVKDALAARGVADDRIEVAGRGQDQPAASNDTEEERAKNRRTEIVVTR